MADCNMPITIMVADDDEDDRFLISEAFGEACSCAQLEFVGDGQELVEHLESATILPGLILLDLNMPRLSGFDALKQIKGNPKLADIPILIFSTSGSSEVVVDTYCNGANTFIQKPSNFQSLTEIVNIVSNYWCKIALLPKESCPLKAVS